MTHVKLIAGICAAAVSLSVAGPTTKPGEPVTAILGAMSAEVSLLEGRLTGRGDVRVRGVRFVTGRLKGRRVVVARSGVGKVNAAMVAALLIDHFEPAEVIFTGVAGGVNPQLKTGDIVIAAKTAQHDLGRLTDKGISNWAVRSPVDGKRNPLHIPADGRLLALAEAAAKRVAFEEVPDPAGGRRPRVVTGVVVTGDVFVASAKATADIRKRMGADALEMEGAAVAQVCRQLGAPHLVIRSISDLADTHADVDFQKFYKVAARNSARIVEDVLARLASGSPASAPARKSRAGR